MARDESPPLGFDSKNKEKVKSNISEEHLGMEGSIVSALAWTLGVVLGIWLGKAIS